jgi:hypothetical protein
VNAHALLPALPSGCWAERRPPPRSTGTAFVAYLAKPWPWPKRQPRLPREEA